MDYENYVGYTFKDLEVEEQALVRTFMRRGLLALANGIIVFVHSK